MDQAFRQEKIYFETRQIDHLGIISTLIRELNLDSFIDELIPFPRGKIPASQRFQALLLNCFGFVKKPLYLTPNFFKKKDLNFLIAPGVEPEDFNDDSLARFLDRISDFGPTKFFQKIALAIFEKTESKHDQIFRIDTTSLSFSGEYEKQDHPSVEITHGYSKDHRPDLKQIVCSLIVVGKKNFPIAANLHSGNASDKKIMPQMVEEFLDEFTEQFDMSSASTWIADSAIYNQSFLDLQKKMGFRWISRVPETTKKVLKALDIAVENKEDEIVLSDNWISDSTSPELSYLEVNSLSQKTSFPHRYIVVSSKKLFEKEKKSFEKKLEKQKKEAASKIKSLMNESFTSKKLAEDALKFQKKQKSFFEIEILGIEKKARFSKRGKPKKGEMPSHYTYHLQLSLKEKTNLMEEARKRLGLFVLGTNIDEKEKKGEEILSEYKSLQGVERGFRFLKNPYFFLDHFFLKKVKRIHAVLCLMACTLLLHGVIENSIRDACEEKEESIPNFAGKAQEKPTAFLCYEYFQGFSSVFCYQSGVKVDSFLERLSEIQKKILYLLGPPYEKMYRLV